MKRAVVRRRIYNISILSVEVTAKKEMDDSDRRVAPGAVSPARLEGSHRVYSSSVFSKHQRLSPRKFHDEEAKEQKQKSHRL